MAPSSIQVFPHFCSQQSYKPDAFRIPFLQRRKLRILPQITRFCMRQSKLASSPLPDCRADLSPVCVHSLSGSQMYEMSAKLRCSFHHSSLPGILHHRCLPNSCLRLPSPRLKMSLSLSQNGNKLIFLVHFSKRNRVVGLGVLHILQGAARRIKDD